MAFEAQECVVAIHAAPVVNYADKGDAAAAKAHLDAGRTSIEGIFDELLDDRGGALDYLARRDLACDDFGEESDAGH